MCDAAVGVDVSSGARLLKYGQLQIYVSTVALLWQALHIIHDLLLNVLASLGAKTAAAKSNARSSLLLLRHASSNTTVQLAAWLPGHSSSSRQRKAAAAQAAAAACHSQPPIRYTRRRSGQLQCLPAPASSQTSSSSSSTNVHAGHAKQQAPPGYRLPPQLPHHLGRLTVVLDLDETLLCTYRLQAAPGQDGLQLVPSNWTGGSSSIRRRSITAMLGSNSSAAKPTTITTTGTGGGVGGYTVTTSSAYDGQLGALGCQVGATCWVHYTPPAGAAAPPTTLAVFERPGLRDFLAVLSSFAELVLFTAASPSYAAPLVDLLDPAGCLFRARLYGDATVSACGRGGVKDMSAFGRDLARVVLVDNSIYSFMLQPSNGLPCLPYHGQAGDGQLLGVILPLLQSLAQVGDIRPLLDSKFRVRDWLASKGKGQGGAATSQQARTG